MSETIGIKKNSAVLVYGCFADEVYDRLSSSKKSFVILPEGRPDLSLSEFSSAKFLKNGIEPILISDNMAGFLFARQLVKEVVVAYHAINGKAIQCAIGSLIFAILGKRHGVLVTAYPAVRHHQMLGNAKELCAFQGERVAPSGVQAYVPLVDDVPRKYVTQIEVRNNE